MSDFELPTRTAGEVTLPGGEVVWVQTLNSLLFEDADSGARWHAQKKARSLMKGEADYPELRAQVKAMSVENQASFLADSEFYTIRRETGDKLPMPPKPEQGEMTPEAFTKSCMEWEEECRKVEKKRLAAEKTRYDAEVKKNTALTATVRMERCCNAYFAQEWGKAFIKRREIETLYRAVRLADDHTKRNFSSPEAYEDADDTVQNTLRDFYFRDLDTVKPDMIPTSPAG